jgi:hypothetical protein
MALNSTYSELTLFTREYCVPKVIDQFFTSNPLFLFLRKSAKIVDGGDRYVLGGSIYTADDAQFIDEWGTITSVYKDEVGAAQLDWKLAVRPVVLSRLAILKNQASQQRRFDLTMQKNLIAAKAMAHTFGKAMFALDYTNTNAINSLDHAISDQTGSGDETGFSATYANIARAATGDTAVWNANIDDSTTTLSIGAANQMFVDCSEGEEHPNLIVSNNRAYTFYYNWLTPMQREGAENLVGRAGFLSVLFNGQPWAVDSHVPSSNRSVPASPWGTAPSSEYVYFLNTNHIELAALKGAFFEFEEVVAPYDRLVHLGRYVFAGNLGCLAPRFQGKMTALTA